MFFSTTTSSVSTLLNALALAASASIPFVAAQTEITTDQLYAKISSTAAPPGYNVEGGSVFGNFVNAVNNKQFFLLATGSLVYERPASEPVQATIFSWCSDLTFSDMMSISNSSLMGYAGRCVVMRLAGYAEVVAAGAQLTYEYSEGEYGATLGISAVYAEQLNVFEGQYHSNTDDYVWRYWDDGSKTAPTIGWEGHDEGDMASNAATASWSSSREITWMSVEEVAQLLNKSVNEFTPEKFKQVYMDTWIKGHEEEATENNPNPEAELEIIEEVKNETEPTDEIVTPAPSGETAENGPIDESGTERKLTSVAARFVSAALRIFGI